MNAIFTHKTIRNYTADPVPDTVLQSVLRAGTRASTTGNMQVYSIVVTSDPVLREQLWAAHFRQNMVKQAPLVLTFCADFNRFNKAFKDSGVTIMDTPSRYMGRCFTVVSRVPIQFNTQYLKMELNASRSIRMLVHHTGKF